LQGAAMSTIPDAPRLVKQPLKLNINIEPLETRSLPKHNDGASPEWDPQDSLIRDWYGALCEPCKC
jgi:hypothetical protein